MGEWQDKSGNERNLGKKNLEMKGSWKKKNQGKNEKKMVLDNCPIEDFENKNRLDKCPREKGRKKKRILSLLER